MGGVGAAISDDWWTTPIVAIFVLYRGGMYVTEKQQDIHMCESIETK